ncbi:MAG: DUF2064 domain-containing protein [Bacteroidota bacterium]
MSQTSAILLFSQSSSVEESSKWSEQSRVSVAISSQLISGAENLCRRSGLDYFRSDETTQLGDDFGQKLAHAIADIFARGYRHLIVVGNDCPGLRASDLRKCKKKLQQGQQVLGPDQRGGVYLLGLQAHAFDPAVFAGLPWQQPSLYTSLVALYPDGQSLRSLRDINDHSDLRRSLFVLHGFRCWTVLLSLFAEISTSRPVFLSWTSAGRDQALLRRGPPVLA